MVIQVIELWQTTYPGHVYVRDGLLAQGGQRPHKWKFENDGLAFWFFLLTMC